MTIRFQLIMNMSADIDDSALGAVEKGSKFTSIFQEFINIVLGEPDIIRSYYSSYFIDCYLGSDIIGFSARIRDELVYQDTGSLFREIAEKHPGETSEYVLDLYDDSIRDVEEIARKELKREILEKYFHALILEKAIFTIIE